MIITNRLLDRQGIYPMEYDPHSPSTNGSNGRDTLGLFAPGCKPGPGNPRAASVQAFRAAILAAVTEDDVSVP